MIAIANQKIFFRLVHASTGEITAIRVPVRSLQKVGAPIPDVLAAMISRLGLAEVCLIDDQSLIFCTERTAASPTPIPRGIELFFWPSQSSVPAK